MNCEKMKLQIIAILVAAIAIPPFMNTYHLYVITLTLIYVILALSFDLLGGHMGYFPLAHHALFATGAYASAIFATRINGSFWLAFPFAVIVTSLVSLAIVFPSLRLKGHYFAIGTLALGEVIIIVINNWVELTRGPFGILDIPKPSLFGIVLASRLAYYYLVLAFTLFTILVIQRVVNSDFGRCIHSIREDETLAESMGLNTRNYKLITGLISGAIAGIAGSLFAHLQTVVTPDSFQAIVLINLIIIVILGGAGNLLGPIIGAFLVVPVLEILRIAIGVRYIIFGVLLLILMLASPKGVVPNIVHYLKR